MNALNLTGLILGFVGAALAFFDSNRTSSRFTEDGISLGYGPELNTWYWRWCGRMGFACLLSDSCFSSLPRSEAETDPR